MLALYIPPTKLLTIPLSTTHTHTPTPQTTTSNGAMAATNSHRYLRAAADTLTRTSPDDQFEFDEAEVWSANDITILPETKIKHVSNYHRKPLRKSVINADRLPAGPKSLPVNIPDWSKILGGAYGGRAGDCEDEYEEEDDDGNDRIAPHEYLARTRVASLSMHEGIGRTLKGRDLSRVRNAIWKKTGLIED